MDRIMTSSNAGQTTVAKLNADVENKKEARCIDGPFCLRYVWVKSHVITGAINHVKNHSNEQRKKDGRLRRYISGREL